MKKIILASGSPQRISMLQMLGFDAQVIKPKIDETAKTGETTRELVLRLAGEKAQSINQKFNIPLIAADTIVEIRNEALGKPKNDEDAFKMLKSLSGKEHSVLTGFAVKLGETIKTQAVETKVLFRELSDDQIWPYIKTAEANDKAGAYGIQGLGAVLVESIEGSYSNVVGLPIRELLHVLEEINHA